MTDLASLALPAVSAINPDDAYVLTQNTGTVPEDRHVHIAMLDDYLTLTLEGQMTTQIARTASIPRWLDYYNTSVTVGNTAAETTLRQYSVPANTLYGGAANHTIAGVFYGIAKQNSTSNYTFTLRLKYGGTTLSTIAPQWNDSASTVFFEVHYILRGNGATNAQIGVIRHPIYEYIQGSLALTQVAGAENSTGALNVTVTAQWQGAHANTTLTVYNHQAWVR